MTSLQRPHLLTLMRLQPKRFFLSFVKFFGLPGQIYGPTGLHVIWMGVYDCTNIVNGLHPLSALISGSSKKR